VAGTGRIKGTAIRPGLTWYEQVHGQDALRRALERCGSEAKPIFQGGNYPFGIVHSGWYDLVMVGDLLDAMIEEVQPVDVEAFHHQMTQAIAQDNVGGVYRALFRLIATPELLQSNIHRVWQTYCDDGNLEVEIPQRGQLRFVIEKLTRHHSTLCLSVGYTIQNVLRSIGFQGLSVQRVACMGEGAPRCVFEGDHL
jgi:hypothetical protein